MKNYQRRGKSRHVNIRSIVTEGKQVSSSTHMVTQAEKLGDVFQPFSPSPFPLFFLLHRESMAQPISFSKNFIYIS